MDEQICAALSMTIIKNIIITTYTIYSNSNVHLALIVLREH